MKRNDNYVIKKVRDKYILVPLGETAINFNGVISLNETARFLWEKCDGDFSECDLEKALTESYGIDGKTAKKAVEIFITRMKEEGCIE